MDSKEITKWQKKIKPDRAPKKMRSPGQSSDPMKIEGDNALKIKKTGNEVNKISRKIFDSPRGSIKKKKSKTSAGKTILRFIEIWNNTPFPHLKKFNRKEDESKGKQTKQYIQTVKYLRLLRNGTLYTGKYPEARMPKDFTPKEAKVNIKQFKALVAVARKKAFDSKFLPKNKDYLQKTSLLKFLIGGGTYGSAASVLLEYAIEPLIPNTPTKPRNPRISEYYKDVYLYLADRKDQSLTLAERNHLVGASNKFLDFFDEFKDPLEHCGYTQSHEFLKDYYWKALGDNSSKVKKIPLGYLNSTTFISREIVPYCLKTGLIQAADLQGGAEDFWEDES